MLAAAVLCLSAGLAPGPALGDGFDNWLAGLRREARAKGIKNITLDAALAGVRPIPKVIKRLKNQPEFKLTLARYMKIVVTPERIADGRARLAGNRALLTSIGRKYGVQPQFIVALWGVETRYGAITGDYPVVGALSTLAYQGSRRRFFRSELLKALRILDQGHITPQRMLGSWAGAMGQNQFMPSSFLNFAVDHDGDGRRDIWRTKADVFASTANYLKRSGWRQGQAWGREVRLPAKFGYGRSRRSVGQWSRLGVRRADGGPLPRASLRGRILMPEGRRGRAFLIYNNFRVILRWNRSNFFAIAVGTLADRIAKAGAK
ncbi:MAG: lytic murein transglycosylase [Alphaproteobacteria bacterium]